MEPIKDKQFYWDLIIGLESRKSEIEVQLSKVSTEEFNEYCLIWELLGPLYKGVSNL